MPALGTIPRLAATVVSRTAHVVTHPVTTVRSAAGLARGAAGVVVIAATGKTGETTEAPGAQPQDATPAGPPPGDFPAPSAQPAAPQPPTTEAQEPAATEPKSPSRNAAHGGPGDDDIDDWHDEVDDGTEVETPVGTTGAGPGFNPDTGETDLQQPGTEPLMDPSLTKQVRAESETLGKAAEPSKE